MVGTFARGMPGVGRDITGFKLNGKAPSVDSPPPPLGEHTASIMAELGCTDAQIQHLVQEKVV